MRNFWWGTSVAAYQVEGGNDAWSDWGSWRVRAGRACDFWNRYEKYLDLAVRLRTNAFRFSLEWARLEPQKGRWSEEAWEHYHRIIRACIVRGLEPFLTLWHFTLPAWVAAEGGWTNPTTIRYFLDYVGRAVSRFGHDVRFWLTLNEPSNVLAQGYLTGAWPPGKRAAFLQGLRCRNHLVEAHREARRIIKSAFADSSVSCVINLADGCAPYRVWHPLDRLIDWITRKVGDYGFLRMIKMDLDFIAINYYYGILWKFEPNRRYILVRPVPPCDGLSVSDIGWPIWPQGLETLLKELHAEFGMPIIVTENGIADADDDLRPGFITEHIAALQRAQSAGVDIRGYFHWSLVDNFEWSHGFAPRFGLYGMDYATLEPYERKSARIYADLIRMYSE